MAYDWDGYEMPEVVFERGGNHVARKLHTCEVCHHDITPGMTYFRYTALVDGELKDEKYHLQADCFTCRAVGCAMPADTAAGLCDRCQRLVDAGEM